MEALHAGYVDALVQEMERAGSLPVKTIYFGGGTPTVLPPFLLARLVAAARSTFDLAHLGEMTIEANPGTVDRALFESLLSMGFTRLSLGVQSFDECELSLLGRIHTRAQAVEAAAAAHAAGFEHLNLDLIYGLPGQAMRTWQASLEAALALQPDHLSLYALTLEEGTPLAEEIACRRLPEPDPDLAADMYEAAESLLAENGFLHYEISNWSLSEAAQCRHNLVYWRNEPYLGLGAGAHSWMDGCRRANVSSPADYVARLRSAQGPVDYEEAIAPDLEIGETMMLGLRLLQEGVEYARFHKRFGVDLRWRFAREIVELEKLGLVVSDAERIRLSERGRLLGNQVFMRFLPG